MVVQAGEFWRAGVVLVDRVSGHAYFSILIEVYIGHRGVLILMWGAGARVRCGMDQPFVSEGERIAGLGAIDKFYVSRGVAGGSQGDLSGLPCGP